MQFVRAWARPTLTSQEWLAGLRGLATPSLEQALAFTDPSNIPARTVTGPATMVRVLPDGTWASFDVATDGGRVRVDVALVQGRWLVGDVLPGAATPPGD